MLSTIVFWISVFFVNIDFGWSCSWDKLDSYACRTSNLFFVGIAVGGQLLVCFMFSFFSQYASCVSFSSWVMLSWLLYVFLFLFTRFGGGLSFRVFCAESLMLLLLSLVIFWFDIFLLIPCFVGFMAGSASLISISLSLSSIFLFVFIFVYSESNTSTIFHYFSLFVTFFLSEIIGFVEKSLRSEGEGNWRYCYVKTLT